MISALVSAHGKLKFCWLQQCYFADGGGGFMAFHSIQRLFSPVQIHYNEAIPIAILGLLVNLIAWLLHDGHHHHHHHHHHHAV